MFKYLISTFSSHEPTSTVLDDAPDKPPTMVVSVVVVLSFLSVFATILLSFPLVQKLADAQMDQADTGMGNSARLNYIDAQNKLLTTFEKTDDTHARIPIDQAMKIVVEKQADVFSQQDAIN